MAEMEPFHFLTLWHFNEPVERVWEELNRPTEFPSWWPGFEDAEALTQGPPGLGSVTRFRVRGDFNVLFDFELKVVEHNPPVQMRLEASGDFVGTGEWKLRPEGKGCAVTYVWNVAVQKSFAPWIRFIPGMRHRMEQSHDRVMTQGGRNLAAILARDDGGRRTEDGGPTIDDGSQTRDD
jgi:uncharacterized protein YndB with AHSA1/START domain